MTGALRQVLAAAIVVLTLALPALAQDLPDYEAWEAVADRAEQVIDGARASEPALETMRGELAGWRTLFQSAQTINASRIESLRNQISALGPAPEDGIAEPDAIAEQRVRLNERLAEALAPARRAEAELQRAVGLIGEIDAEIATRQTGELLSLGPSPLNPFHWPGALAAIGDWGRSIGAEYAQMFGSAVHRAQVRNTLPIVLILLVAGVVLIWQGGRVIARLSRGPISREESSPVARLILFGLSILTYLVPYIGIILVLLAVQVSGMVGIRGSVIMQTLGPVAWTVLAAMWLSRQIFPIRETAVKPVNVSPGLRAQGRWSVVAISVVIALWYVFLAIADAEDFSDIERHVLIFPAVVLMGLLLIRIGRILIRHSQNSRTDLGDASMGTRLFATLGRAVIALGIAGPVVAGIGYFTAGSTFLVPATLSLALLALVGILQRLISDLYAALTRNRDGLEDSLIPTFVSFALALLSLPLFAMIWGTRPAQLLDLWGQVIEGFTLGGVTISPRNFLIFVVIFAAGYTATRLLQATLRASVLPKTKMDAGGRNAVLSGTGYIGIFLAALLAITGAGIDLSSLAIVAGALSVGIGFGLQTIVSNFVSGVILLIERPIKQGDWIEVNGMMGYVREISVRSTRIETFDRSDVIVPNADLIAGVVTNMTHHNNTGRAIVPVGVAYGTDTRLVEGILREIAEAHPMVLLNPPPAILFKGFGADSLDFEIRAILRDVNFVLSVHSDMNHEIARRFAEKGIEIPFAQRDVWLRNPEVLRPDAGPDTEGKPAGPAAMPTLTPDDGEIAT